MDRRLARIPALEDGLVRINKRLTRAGRIRDRQFDALKEQVERRSLGLRLLHRLRK